MEIKNEKKVFRINLNGFKLLITAKNRSFVIPLF